MITVHPGQDDLNLNYSHMMCRAYIQLPLNVDEIDASIDTNMLENTHILLVHKAALDNGRKPDIITFKKDRGDIFL